MVSGLGTLAQLQLLTSTKITQNCYLYKTSFSITTSGPETNWKNETENKLRIILSTPAEMEVHMFLYKL